MPKAPKLAIIGIDSADWRLMEPWLETGDLPNIAAVIDSGCRSPLRSTVPPSTACAWPSMMTGVNPGKNGVFGFVEFRDDYTPRLMSNVDRQAPALWDLLAERLMTVGVYNVPMTYPPNQVNGYMVSGEIGAVEWDESLCRPRELFEELAAVVPPERYEMEPVHQRQGRLDLAGLERQVAARRTIACHLLDHHPTDVFIGVVNYVDHIQHRRLGKRRAGGVADVVRLAYQAADEFVGAILERCDDDTAVLIVSDHGSGPVEGYFDLNAMLASLGYLRYKPEAVAQFEAQQRRAGWRRQRYALSRRIPGPLKSFVRRLLGRSQPAAVHPARPRDLKRDHFAIRQNLALTPAVDWERTRAYSAGLYLSARLNLKGREQQGIVAPEEYEGLRAEITGRLNEIKNPLTGETDLGAMPADEVYSGEHMQWAPDIIGVPQGGALTLKNLPGNERRPFLRGSDIWADYPWGEGVPGTHRMDGILACRAPRRQARMVADQPTVMDIAPTALALLGLPIPAHLDGRVILDLPQAQTDQTGGGPWRRAEGPGSAYDDEEEKKVERRLKDLGYL